MKRFDFCEAFLHLKGQPFSFAGRPYLRRVYNSTARRIVLRTSRQVEKTTFLCNVIAHTAATTPGVHIIAVFPRQEQAGVFAKSRLLPTIEDSPVLRRSLLGSRARKPQVTHMQFRNRSEVYIRAAYHSADAARGIDGDVLIVDEFQDVAGGDLPILEETLSHSSLGRVYLTGTPKSIDNHLEDAFNRSTANEWRVPCACGKSVFLDDKCLGAGGPVCPDCELPLDPGRGQWVPRNAESTWGDGFTFNHLVVPWLNYQELLERRNSYNPALFRNECLGLPTILGDHIVTRAEVEACCGNWAMVRSFRDIPQQARNRVVAGVDWGGGTVSRSVLAIGYMTDNNQFVAVFLERYPAQEEPNIILDAIARRCQQFGVRLIAADGRGNGSVYNSLLLERLPQLARLFAMIYAVSDQQPCQYKGRLWHWSIGRTPSLGMIFSRIKKKLIAFPRVADCSSYLDEICCEFAEYENHNRTIKYTHAETQQDDTLHAINYVVTLARRWLDRRLYP